MTKAWIISGVLCAICLVIAFTVLPSEIFSHMDAMGNMSNLRPRNFTLGMIAMLQLSVNLLLFMTYNLSEGSRFFAALNIPHKSFWMSTPENRSLLKEKLQKTMAATGAYVNFLFISTLYMMIHYYYPQSIPCPRHILMMLIWIILTFALIGFTFQQFKKPNEQLKP